MTDEFKNFRAVLNEEDQVVLIFPEVKPEPNGIWRKIFSPSQADHLAGILEELSIQAGRNRRIKEGKARREAAEKVPVNRSDTTLTDGSPVTPDHREINPATGMQKGYVVLSESERAKGFVRPVRRTYVHVGRPTPKYPLLDLTEEQKERTMGTGYVKFEAYPEGSSATGRYWTQAEIDRINRGCGSVTTMGQALAETYSRDPGFYSGTYCAACQTHFPVGEQGEFVWEDGTRVGT
jgi:hypothetical protein